ncbi:enoyl-CoA hydratase-related protein [Paraburkholderia rhizosphaerae]|uniref:Enoyl-CoA hydratase/carnithine racemase n=1 Tax=Paraburkholderia rhizosphaerae TaxID=480658 RepID=A0A4R8L478_9BURK|nr:enoyl-CoA hydratase-related protein [Paraburkholderia rhizosphaerae]TDY37055.1 enoyl-CoA hydratase/carnithine racemase [Paraburkholderia rhizosphaerae]
MSTLAHTDHVSSDAEDAVATNALGYRNEEKLTIERRGEVVLLGINRPHIHNRIDPETYRKLARAYYDYEHDPSLRAAVLFGHGPNFSRGVDVEGFKELVLSGKPLLDGPNMIDPLAKETRPLKKPLIVVVHGDTWNLGHELHLVADIRIAAEDTEFGQDENSHGRFPGGGATIRFVREAGWGNAMRYMLTGQHWSAQEAYRMGVVQAVKETQSAALDEGVAIARQIADCAPLGVQMTLRSSHLYIDPSETEALALLGTQYTELYRTQDFSEGRDAYSENRKPRFEGR